VTSVRSIVAVCLAAALLPTLTATASTQTLGLDGILAAPPTADYVELLPSTAGILEGPFDAAGYAGIGGQVGASKTIETLQKDGFISGFGKAWVQQANHRVMVEIIVAFTGGSGAHAWLMQSKEADLADPTYQHALTIDGIDSYYGVRLSDLSRYFADAYLFVKGNDGFLVSTISDSDNLGDSAAAQTRVQYQKAPPYTIPPSGWPGAPHPLLSLENVKEFAGRAGAALTATTAALGIVVIAVLMWRRRRRDFAG
jgi:hypothetical protein